jgi:hypothetical protein
MSVIAEQPISKPEDPLTTARRDFEAIKSGKTPATPAESLRLQGSVPLVDTTVDAPVPLSPIQRARKLEALKEQSRAASSRHWLLDAMGGQSPAAEADTAQALPLADSSKTDPRANPSNAVTKQLRAAGSNFTHLGKASQGAPASVAGVASNPLQQYMAGWLAPRDLQLLRSTTSSGAMKNELPKTSPTSFGSLMKDFAPTTDAAAFSFPSTTRRAVTPSGVSNPYLSDVLTNISVSPPAREGPLSAAIPVQPPPNATPATLFPATPSPLELKATEAEKLKRTDDGKYFRQLKRF